MVVVEGEHGAVVVRRAVHGQLATGVAVVQEGAFQRFAKFNKINGTKKIASAF